MKIYRFHSIDQLHCLENYICEGIYQFRHRAHTHTHFSIRQNCSMCICDLVAANIIKVINDMHSATTTESIEYNWQSLTLQWAASMR